MKTRIGFIYYTFFPVTGGASVHGYNLARELHNLGYELWKLNGKPDPWTVKQPRGPLGLFRIIRHCDIIYVRMDYFLNFRNLIAVIALLCGKRIIAELNMPSDELHLFGRGRRYIWLVDRICRFIFDRFDAVIVVSPGIDKWCRTELGLTNTHIIENGGERFDEQSTGGEQIDDEAGTGGRMGGGQPRDNRGGRERFGNRQAGREHPGGEGEVTAEMQDFSKIREQFDTVIVWSGSANEMQDLEWLRQIAEKLEPDQALMLALFDTAATSTGLPEKGNIFQFRNPSRARVRQMILHADIGLAFYNSSSWSRWGFYNSPLKIHEYLVNGLLAVTNIDGSPTLRAHPRFRQVTSVDDVPALIRDYRENRAQVAPPTENPGQAEDSDQVQPPGSPDPAVPVASQGRTWADVASETDRVIRQVLSRKNR